MTYTFSFDARACSGCKACQEACKDRNDLPVGVLWRRVIEVTGGEWQRCGDSWENSVFAYSLSLACSHCAYPKCAGVCPVDAFSVRPDGIVLLDSSRCMGCGYCAWACPYGAPQFDPSQRVMTKCNFCFDALEMGQKPACVAACPLRVLDVTTAEEWKSPPEFQPLWAIPSQKFPFPLPSDTHTQPRLAIHVHPGMESSLQKNIANREEIQPPRLGKVFHSPAWDELPLVIFTLLTQLSVGMSVCLLALPRIPLALLFSLGLIFGLGGLASFLHLGRKRNAWRVLVHLRKSWLSREVLLSGLFMAAWALTAGLKVFQMPPFTVWIMALAGVVLVYCMAQVYRLKTVPQWNSWRTALSFFLSTLVLGGSAVNLFTPSIEWVIIFGLALLVELILALADRSFTGGIGQNIRIALLGIAIMAPFLQILLPSIHGIQSSAPMFVLILLEETIARIHFYWQLSHRLL